jgi:CHAT domain-containing protein
MKLNADLVTLSACETALGRVEMGDDVVGFTRAFLYAGAGSLVSSLWGVDDKATKELMVRFYDGLSNHSKRDALRQAQIVAKRGNPHPFFWAPFILVGDWR